MLHLNLIAMLVVASQVAWAEQKPAYLSLETPPAPELSPSEALHGFSVAPGFKVELVAAEPLVEDPVAIAWDETGDLYVVEMRGFMPDAYGHNDTEPVGAVVRLRDENGDGRFDQRQVMLDQLVLPRAIAIVNEGLLIGEPPNLWLCPSLTGRSIDIDCQAKKRLASYGDLPGNVEHVENGLLMAVDNWLYNAKSDRRMRIIDDELVVEATLFRGQWGITQDNQGQLFYNTNSNFLLGDFYDAQPVIAAGNAGGPGLNIPISRNDQVYAVRVNPGVNRAYVPGVLRDDGRLARPTSASGMAYYRGDQFPEEYRQDVFVAEPAGNVVVQLRLSRQDLIIGSQHILYDDKEWQQRDFLASTDERFRPVDVDVGPDGALYVVDMYRGIIQDHIFLSDELRAQALSRGLDKPLGMGRIWRITSDKASSGSSHPDFPADGLKLVARLQDNNGWNRDTAQRLLLGQSGKGIDRALRRLVKGNHEFGAVHAVWTLNGRGSLDHRTVAEALSSRYPSVRLAALRAGHELLSVDVLLALAGQTKSAAMAQHATLYLAGKNKNEEVITYLADRVLSRDLDDIRRMAIQSASRGNELTLIKAVGDMGWSELDEQSTGFFGGLVRQLFRADPAAANRLLEYVMQLDQRWQQVVVLTGIFEVTREDTFSRVVLGQPHPLFIDPPDELWPVIARARTAFTWAGDDLAAGAKPLSADQQARKDKGELYYKKRCAICHANDGGGITSLGPPLAASQWVTGPSERLARIVLQGLQGPISVKGTVWDGMMPGHQSIAEFDPETASGLLTFLHRAWGHSGRLIEPAFIYQVQRESRDHEGLWTAEELAEIDINSHYQRYTGTYGGGSFRLKFTFDGRDLMVQSVYFNGPMREDKEDHFSFQAREFRIEFIWADSGVVKAVRMSNQGGLELPRLAD